jgi:fibronectin type 3 domain-containing protein
MLLIPRTASTYLSLEYRRPYGSQFETFSSTEPVANGVSVRVTPSLTSRSQSQLVDATPSTTSYLDAALAAGQTLVDPLSGVSITVLSVSPSGVTVRISFAADTSAPSAPASLSASALDTSRVSLSWPASTDDVAVTGYRVYRNTALIATVSTTTFTDGGLASGTTYAYQVVAFDAAGNVSAPASASATTVAADTQAPTAPTDLRATTSRPRKVRLTWTASVDNVAVTGYRIYRNGILVRTTTTTSFGESLSSRTRSATYYVVAFDAAGNASGRSTSVTVSF